MRERYETTLSGDDTQSESRSRVSQKQNTNQTEQRLNLQSLGSHPGLPLDDSALSKRERERARLKGNLRAVLLFVALLNELIYHVAHPGALGSVVVATEPMTGVMTLTSLSSRPHMKAFCVDLKCIGKSMKSQLCSAVKVQRVRRRLTLLSPWFQSKETSPRRSPRGEISRHSRLINLLGVKQIYIGAHKMDERQLRCHREEHARSFHFWLDE